MGRGIGEESEEMRGMEKRKMGAGGREGDRDGEKSEGERGESNEMVKIK